MLDRHPERGIALITVLLFVALAAGLLASTFVITSLERDVQRSSMAATRGFYAAEAGLNLRAAAIRREFDGYRRPTGTSPIIVSGRLPCAEDESSADAGDGDFACVQLELGNREVRSYVVEAPDNPSTVRIPPGELFQNLVAQEYRYTVSSASIGRTGRPEALLDMEFKSRLIPLFQFAVFYNKDLEILPGPTMTLAGPVHSNKDLYLGSITNLTIGGQVTAAGRLFHGRKDDGSCQGGGVSVFDPLSARALPDCDSSRFRLFNPALIPWNGMVRVHVEELVVPEPESLDAQPGRLYWDRADLRLVLDLNDATPSIEIRRPDGTPDLGASTLLDACTDTASPTLDTLYNMREGHTIDLLEIDLAKLIDCIDASPTLQDGRGLDDATDGGLVWHFSVDGPRSGNAESRYGVRISNGEMLAAASAGAPEIRGLTIVSDQALYVKGDFNSVGSWRPAALMADSMNVLSGNWDDANSGPTFSRGDRQATPTTIRAAFLAGTDTTGYFDGDAGRDNGNYNGGVENYPRFHETWSGVRMTYVGSFVSLGEPRHVDGAWGNQDYDPPNRDWSFEQRFSDAAQLPPLSPRAVFLHQELFERSFEL